MIVRELEIGKVHKVALSKFMRDHASSRFKSKERVIRADRELTVWDKQPISVPTAFVGTYYLPTSL